MHGRTGHSATILPVKSIDAGSRLATIKLTVTNPTLQYPFVLDGITISHIKKSKVMFLLRGLPGSGKSTLAEILRLLYPGSVVCSADRYFLNKDGIYKWCNKKLKEAHESCQRWAERTCSEGKILIVDNSNVREWEMRFYFQLAELHSYITVLVETKTSWRNDVTQLALKTEHDVDVKILAHKLQNYEPIVPSYFGWFLNDTDSRELFGIAKIYLQKCSKFPEFKKHFHTGNHLDVLQYYSLGSVSDILHCTANYCEKGKVVASQEYAWKDCVKKSYGKALQLHVIGFIITPRTFGARVKLSPENLCLWNGDDHEKQSPSETRDATGNRRTDALHLATSLSALQISGAASGGKHSTDARGARSGRRVHTTCVWEESDVPRAQFYKPLEGRGSRAHITLGCSADWPPVQTGFDQIEIVQLENKKRFQPPRVMALDGLADACDYGEGRWVIYLRKQLALNTVFTGCF